MIFNPISCYNIEPELLELLGKCADSLSISGDWTNTQYAGSPVDYTGLVFTVIYNDGTTASVTPTSISPSVWGSTVGEQTCTFTYEENGFSVSSSKSAEVLDILSSIQITTQPTKTTYNYGDTFDATGAVVTANWQSGASTNVTSECTWSPLTLTTVGTQTITVSYTYDGVTKTDTTSVTVIIVPVSLTISGDWSNTQYTGQAVDTTGLTFTVAYNDGTSDSKTASQLTISPSTWSSTIGTQSCTFSYTENGVTVSTSKSANVADYQLTVPLTLQARGDGNIRISSSGNSVYYSKNGSAQAELPSGTNISVVTGDKVSFYRTLSGDLDSGTGVIIRCTNNCYVYGNIMSLYNKDNFINLTTIEYKYAFHDLFFQNTYIDVNESVGKLILPATTLANYCYYNMFRGCTSLTTAPELPATTLAENCYENMFNSCDSLTTAPYILPATTLANYCYAHMFERCESLTTAPELPATTLANYCCENMFRGCTSLTTAPELPATTLANNCYAHMFNNCSSLTTAPVLPATTLIDYCYFGMFSRCTSLTTITCLATDISANSCINGWVYGVASSGTFYKNPAMSSWTTGDSGIPEGWTVQDYQG